MLNSFIGWFRSPIFPESEAKTRSALLLNVVINTFLFSFFIIIMGAVFTKSPRINTSVAIVSVGALALSGIRIAMLRGKVAAAGKLTILLVYIIVTLAVYNAGTIRIPGTSFYLLIIVMAGLIVSRRAIFWAALINSLTIVSLLIAEQKGFLPFPDLKVTLTQGITFTVIFTITAILLYLAVKNIDEALAQAHNELAERIRAEKERENLIAQLKTSNAELERFAYTISHDLRNPLVTIKGFVGMLRQDIHQNHSEKIPKDLQRIEDAADKMQTLLYELLEFSRIGRIVNPPEKIEVFKLVNEAIKNMDSQISSKNIIITNRVHSSIIHGDYARLREVFENLIENAAKYIGEQISPMIEIGEYDVENERVFFVKDNGIGIDSKYHEKIFGLFEKLDSASEGTGIGLALIKRIIEFHNGRIWVESDGQGKGSTFYFTIPDAKKGV